MIINKGNDGRPTGFIKKLILNERVVTLNRATRNDRYRTRPKQRKGEDRDILRRLATSVKDK
jgi:hypothetical protein